MEDRMLSDEILLGIINSKSGGGGGGGTTNYNDLSNQPQINGNTLTGNKSASDLGLADSDTVDGILDGTNIDSFADVEAALAGKQDALTAGKYINIDANNEISVDPVVPNEAFTYTIQQIGDGIVKITKTVSGAVVFEKTYNGNADITLDALHYVYSNGVQSYTLLIASDTHEAGFKQSMSWWARDTFTENFSTVDHSGEKLIIKSEMDDALALKQDKTDNSLQTTDKTVVGAVNELKSGLTNLDVALSVPEGTGKNLIGMTLDRIKALNTTGTWSGNSYTINGVTFTVDTDGNGRVIGIITDGTASGGNVDFVFSDSIIVEPNTNYIVTGCPNGGGASTYRIRVYESTWGQAVYDAGSGFSFNSGTYTWTGARITVYNGVDVTGKTFYPMVRLASVSDPTFAPYIPSVESRIEAVESNLTGNWRQVTFADVFTFAQDVTTSLEQNCAAWVRGDRVRIKLFVRGSITTTSTGYKTIGNVSNNYRPTNNTIMPGFVNSRSDGTQMLASASYAINTNGNINLLYGDTATLGSAGSDWLGGNSILFEWSIK